MPHPTMASALPLLALLATAAAAACGDAASCEARVQQLSARLESMRDEMRFRQRTLGVLEDLRSSILSGRRIELPSAQRQHLERGSPLISGITYDARHRPVSTNLSRHFQPLRRLAEGLEVRFQAFMPLKRSSSSAKPGPAALVAVVDGRSRLSLFSLEGEEVLRTLDLGHEGGKVAFLALSPSQESHFVATADESGGVRVHNLKVTSKKAEGAEENSTKRMLVVSANFSVGFEMPKGPSGEVRKLTSLLPIERSSQVYFVAGDHLGGISVFFRNGTLKGRAKVSDDPNGIRGLQRSQGQMVLFYTSHSFGFFSSTQVDVQHPPCTGWNAPLFDVALEPSAASSRVVLALADGDVLVYSTTHGKSKACDLSLKFPHVSPLPFRLFAFKGHVMGLVTPLPETRRRDDYLRELFFFSMAAMDAGYGTAPSRAVTLQVDFGPRIPEDVSIFAPGPSMGSNDRSKSQVVVRFANSSGVELYDLSLKTPPPPKTAAGGEESWPGSGWLGWLPKVGVFGVALVGVVLWNVRKVAGQRRTERQTDDFGDDYFKERVRERREKRERVRQTHKEEGGLGSMDD